MSEFLFLGVLALLVIGPKQLPELARHLGRFLNELRRATDGFTSDLRQHTRIDFDLESRRLRDPEAENKTEAQVIPQDADKPEKPS